MASTDQIIEQVNEITNSDKITGIILDIADGIEFSWFEWAFKVGVVVVGFLLSKHLVYSLFYYFKMRMDDHIGVGAIIRFNDSSILGRIQSYNLTAINIETMDGLVRVPLAVWNNTHWTLVKNADVLNFAALKESNKNLILEIEQKNIELELERKKNKDFEERLMSLENLAEQAQNNH